jgi:hypothetical protein
MSRKTVLMFILTGVAVVLCATRFVPAVALPIEVSDFFGGAAVGLLIGSIVSWLAERS